MKITLAVVVIGLLSALTMNVSAAICNTQLINLCIASDLITTIKSKESAGFEPYALTLSKELSHYRKYPLAQALLKQLGRNSIPINKDTSLSFFDKNQNLTQESIKRFSPDSSTLNNNHKSNDILVLSPLLYVYREALLQVLPIQANQLKQRLNEAIANKPVLDQALSLADIALVEVFSGDTKAASQSMHHANLLLPNHSELVLISHLVAQLIPIIEHVTKHTGFASNQCPPSHEEQIAFMSTLLSDEYQTLDNIINSIPNNKLKLRSYVLLSSYLERLNLCHPQHRYFEYRAFQTVANLKSTENKLALGVNTMIALRRYKR